MPSPPVTEASVVLPKIKPFNPLPTGRSIEDAVVHEDTSESTIKQYSAGPEVL